MAVSTFLVINCWRFYQCIQYYQDIDISLKKGYFNWNNNQEIFGALLYCAVYTCSEKTNVYKNEIAKGLKSTIGITLQ